MPLNPEKSGSSPAESWRRWQARGSASQRVDYWQAVVCEAVLDVDMTPGEPNADAPFYGSIFSRDVLGARLVNFRSAAHQIRRPARLADRTSHGYLMVSLQSSGLSRLTQRRGEVCLQPGDIGVVDSAAPFQIEFPGNVARQMVLLPRQALQSRAPTFRVLSQPAHLVATDTLTPVIAQTMRSLTALKHPIPLAEIQVLLQNLTELLALRLSPSAGADEFQQGRAAYEQICRYIDQHLGDPALSPTRLAQVGGMSLRTLQRLFQRFGPAGGIERHIFERRLQLAHELLTQSRARTISEAAFAAGFAELSHFSRRYQARFGQLPSSTLRQSLHYKK